ncbi:MAG TPA: ATP synthase F1 subunit gamma [Candidatus Sulfotelmatobacter sp.]|nr:ATP synthase F1 subunit gamma [Candidatus Sulfotelmatobacter sp.]
MASLIILKRRIGSVRNMRQITKAMELVSASKLRRAQQYAARSRDYRDIAYDMLRNLNASAEVAEQPLFAKRKVKNRLYVIVTSNMGLAGAYNSNNLKMLTEGLKRDQSESVKSHVIVIGNKGAQFVRRLKGVELVAVYPPFSDQPTVNEMRPLLTTVIDMYEKEQVDDVEVIYTIYHSAVSQQAVTLEVLPAPAPDRQEGASSVNNFEPDIEAVIEEATTRLVEAQIWQAILESLASEHAMRMIATKNATDNANELIGDYTLELNTARQAAITQELAEISGGVEALTT